MGTLQNFSEYKPGGNFVRGIPFKAHKITGFSPEFFESRYENLYGGAVRQLNDIEQKLARLNGDEVSFADIGVLKNRELQLANEIMLHEVSFECLGEDGGEDLNDSALQNSIDLSFGNFAKWREEFTSLALSAKSGWIVLVWSIRFGRLSTICVTDATMALAGAQPLLAIDVNENAYTLDFGSDRRLYVDAIMNNIHWGQVAKKFGRAVFAEPEGGEIVEAGGQITIEELKAMADGNSDEFVVLDVRHDDDRERYKYRIMQTSFQDSFDVKKWVDEVPKDKPVIVYCMYGFWVSQKVAEELRDEGIDARSLSGGVTAWRAMGFPSSVNEY